MHHRTNAFQVLLIPFIGSAKDNLNDPAFLPGLERTRDLLIEIVDTFETRQEEVQGNLDLTIQAQQRLVAEARESAIEKVAAVKDLSDQEAQLHGRIFSPGPELSEVGQILDFLRLQEIRQALRSLDSLQLQARLEKALSNDEDHVLDAVAAAPYPMIDREILDGILERRAFSRLEAESPALLKEFEDVKLVNGLVLGMKNVTRQHLKQ